MTGSDEADVKVGGLAIWVRGRQFPSATDYWDGNWLVVSVLFEASGAVIRAEGSFLRTDELESFAEALARLDLLLVGRAALAPMEPVLRLEIAMAARGSAVAKVELRPSPQQRHSIEFELDQSYFPAILAQCRQVLRRFPVVGARAQPSA